MNDLVSIIVPVYNVSKYIDKCISSIVNQTYQNIEIILVDDGTKDDSGIKCDAWKEKDHRIVVVHKENGGLSSARNCGLDIAKGKYIMFVDSDDFVSNNIVEIMYKQIIDNLADISICEVEHIFDSSSFNFSVDQNCKSFSSNEAIKEMWYQRSFLPSAWGKLYKATLFKDIRFTLNRLYEDIDIMHEVFWRAEKIVYSNSKMYGYVHREESITTQKFSKRDLDILLVAKKILDFAICMDKDLIPAAQSYYVVANLRVYLNAPNSNEYGSVINQVDKSLKQYAPSVIKDKNIRRKLKYALFLYLYCKPMMKGIYKHINRWK